MRIGLAGAGLIGRQHLAALDRVPEVTLSAVYDPAAEAQDWPTVDSLDALAACSDGVILAVPNALHAEMTLQLIAAGCPVLVEKPLTPSAEAGRAVVDAATAADVPVLVGHHRRHNPIVSTAHDILQAGTLGTVTTVQAMCWLPKPDAYFAAQWRQQAGAGPLFINLIHDVDVLMYLCGPITQVQAFQSNAIRGSDAEEVTVATLRFASGALGTVNLCDVAVAPWSWELTAGENPAYPRTDQSCYMIGGTRGSLSLPNLAIWRQEDGPDWWAPMASTRVPLALSDPLADQLRHFADVIARRVPPKVTAADGLRAVQVIDAIKQAARTGTAQTID